MLQDHLDKANRRRTLTAEDKKRLTKINAIVDKLKETIMIRNRSDAYHRRGKKSAIYRLDSKCKNLCEDALEILQEIAAADTSL